MSSSLRSAAACAALVGALALAGCGGDDGTTTGSTGKQPSSAAAGADQQLAATVPAKFKDKGALIVAADATYPPNEYIDKDGKTVVGMDPDLAHALGRVLGLKAEVRNATFDSIIPGLASGRFDVGLSSFTDTKEREQTVDFVTYYSAGTSFYTTTEGGVEVSGLADLCGKSVAVEKGTTQQDDSTAQSKKCTAAGKPAVKVSTFPDQNGANLALSSGRAQIGMADSPVADFQVKQSGGKFKLVGKPYGTAPYGIAVPKGSGLAKPLLGALQKLIADGSYKKILDKWGLAGGAISNPTINGATS